MATSNRRKQVLKRRARTEAKRYGIDPDLLVAQLNQESGFQENVGSPAGARGVAQFMPGTAKSYNVNLDDNRSGDDIRGAAHHMSDLLKQFGGDRRQALAAYNAGAGAVQKYGGVPPYAETQRYVNAIISAAGKPSGVFSPSLKRDGSSSRKARTSEKSTYTPGVDKSALRQQAMLSYLDTRGKPGSLLDLKNTLDNSQDVAPTRTPGVKAPVAKSRGGGGKHDVLELFWNGPGAVNIKDGQRVGRGFVSGHEDHVHVASGPKQTVAFGRLAESMGLTVRENKAFDQVDPVHAQGSYHYRNQAIDVSGDPQKMAAFARRVARMSKPPRRK